MLRRHRAHRLRPGPGDPRARTPWAAGPPSSPGPLTWRPPSGGATRRPASPRTTSCSSPPNPDEHRAKQICRTCPVTEPCLAQALEVPERWGVWGGLDERQRAAQRRRASARRNSDRRSADAA
ncbi:WhiB family transcriptional regulator [Isoptericola croceus]|uniref:WhiB family transcriptional regulator n=1 Tax=Isoptericola croceus TaxID=3031406 RepID=UPI0027B95C89